MTSGSTRIPASPCKSSANAAISCIVAPATSLPIEFSGPGVSPRDSAEIARMPVYFKPLVRDVYLGAGFSLAGGFASNGYGEHSPGGFSMLSAIVIEIVLTCGFLLVIHGATDKNAPAGFAPIAIGLALTLIHLISIPVTNTSVNPARSTAVAIFQGGWALQQLWLFWVMPIIGGILGGVLYRTLLEKRS